MTITYQNQYLQQKNKRLKPTETDFTFNYITYYNLTEKNR